MNLVVSTAILAFAQIPASVSAQVNKGNLEVAKICSDAAGDLLTLSALAPNSVFRSELDPVKDGAEIEDRLMPKLALLHNVVAAEHTYAALVEHGYNSELSRAIASVPRCATGEFCLEGASGILASAGTALIEACRADYLGEE